MDFGRLRNNEVKLRSERVLKVLIFMRKEGF